MDTLLREHADFIVRGSIGAVMPDAAVLRALKGRTFPGRVLILAVGKAAWRMARTAAETVGGNVARGIVITKYGHLQGPLKGFECFEAGHPVPDENSFRATDAAVKMVSGLRSEDTVLFLLSGGGSALFEKPLVPPEEIRDITGQLLACGADITEINTIRKRLSAVKGGRFAQMCRPARVETVILSDVLGDAPDMIASGPACPDTSTHGDAMRIIDRYGLRLSGEALKLMEVETPKALDNVRTCIGGGVRELCAAAEKACRQLGYEPLVLTDRLCCRARDAGSFLASILRTHENSGKSLAFIAGGEPVVDLTGHGLGGRAQELALAAAPGIGGITGAAVFSFGSDGTDGPTDAAGGYVDGDTCGRLKEMKVDIHAVLRDNDAYHALEKTGGLIVTGPTGTNVNDLAVALLRRG